jgi:hypothetical protein
MSALEREKILLLSTQLRTVYQLCPRCGQPTLERVHLPWYLRPIRLIRPLRAYSCIACGHFALLSGEPHGGRQRKG